MLKYNVKHNLNLTDCRYLNYKQIFALLKSSQRRLRSFSFCFLFHLILAKSFRLLLCVISSRQALLYNINMENFPNLWDNTVCVQFSLEPVQILGWFLHLSLQTLRGVSKEKEKIKHFIKVLSYHVAMTMAHKMYNEDKCGQWDNCPQATYVCPLNWSSSTHLPLSGSSSRPPHSPERVPSAGRGGVWREKEGERERE